MPKTFSRACDRCGEDYEGYGAKYCSQECSRAAKRDNKKALDPSTDDLPPPGECHVSEDHGDGEYAVFVDGRENDAPQDLDDLLELTDPDLDVWEVSKWQIKPYNAFYKDDEENQAVVVPMYSSYIRFKRRDDAPLHQAAEAALKKMGNHAPVYPDTPRPVIKPKDERHMLELVIPDLHLGKLAWHRETGEDYDSDIASRRFMQAIDNLLQRARTFGVDRWLLVVGNDLLHTDNIEQTTTAGTPQDVDSRHAKMVETACDLLVEAIDTLLEIAPGTVVGLPGNHDREEAISIARYLKAWYRNCEAVEVDAEPSPRKYHKYGEVLLGFCHGQEAKIKSLPSVMPVECPEMWADSTYREWHLGHYHKKKEYAPIWVNEHQGVRIRHLSSLTGTDAWHHRRGYVGNVKAAEGFMWNAEDGLQAIFNWNVPTNEAAE